MKGSDYMYNVMASYEDGSQFLFENIDKIGYYEHGELTVFKGDELIKHAFQLTRTYYLFSNTSCAAISDHLLRSINIYTR